MHCNALHILPFFESPIVDKGYDVSDFFKLREGLGSTAELQDLRDAAQASGIRLFMDLVVNHVSEQHEWFKQAQAGNEHFRSYFITSWEKPQFLRKVNKKSRVVAVYRVGGEEVEVNIAFPEFTWEIPHWRQGSDGCWYYHTYYPQEVDLNWMNPEVFIQFGKIILHWANLGFHFRLDAILFIGRGAYKRPDRDNANPRRIAAALRCISERIHITSASIVETYETLPAIMEYFGTETDPVAQLAYNFHLCTKIWISLCKANVNFIWYVLNAEQGIPSHAQWLNFLRNHDELSLAHLTAGLTHDMYRCVGRHGRDFNEGHGICGRTYALLGCHPARYRMAYTLLASFPGSLLIMYGDEIGRCNTPVEELPETDRRDLRNINRGVLEGQDYATAKAESLLAFFSRLLEARRELAPYLEAWPERLGQRKDAFSAIYRSPAGTLVVHINLSPKRFATLGSFKGMRPAFTVNQVRLRGNALVLGPYAGIWLLG
jgi:maltose alpha-D-glucosyltransferase/alpha-amylase